MEIASVRLSVIAHNTAADICFAFLAKLILDVVGYLANVFGNTLGVRENAVVYALEYVFPFASVIFGLDIIGIVYISRADTFYRHKLALERERLYYFLEQIGKLTVTHYAYPLYI
jgi:hypothetical protein